MTLPPLGALLCGVLAALAVLALGWFVGGQATLGRIDPSMAVAAGGAGVDGAARLPN